MAKAAATGPWLNIGRIDRDFLDFGVTVHDTFHKKVGNGNTTRFWLDGWFGRAPFKDLFPHLYALDTFKNCKVSDRIKIGAGKVIDFSWNWSRKTLPDAINSDLVDLVEMLKCYDFADGNDKWNWVHDASGLFSVSSARKLLLSKLNKVEKTKDFRWIKWVPSKVSCFNWRLKLNKIPVRSNLARRGIEVQDLNCPHCGLENETIDHVFVKCPDASEVWRRVAWWCDVRWYAARNVKDLFDVASQNGGSKDLLKLKTSILYSTVWFIWKARNNRVFRRQSISIDSFIEDCSAQLFSWVCNRSKHKSINWQKWCLSPLSCFS
ncbi:putative reverse transcriptase zinc-binding domain-containing protein [Helianthus annuus]|nr:putative reverse transcriptase zinc-binding domain-containing protein [Helianthus annuus]